MPPAWAWAWLGILGGVVAVRWTLFAAYHRRAPGPEAARLWAWLFAVPAVFTGLLWGVAGWFLVVPDYPPAQLVTTIIIAGMVAGAMATLRTLPHIYAAFAAAAVLPVTLRFLQFGGIEFALMAGAFTMFWALMVMQAFSICRQFRVSEARRLSNLRLVERLRAARQAAEDANAAKLVFLATMSHKIRTPMTGVMGYADILLDGDLSAESRTSVRKIKDSTVSLLRVINDILDMSKLEAGKVEIEMLDFRPADLLSDVIAMFKGIAKPGVAVELALADDLPDPIRADPTRLRQVLVNLVGNDVKFTHQGFVRLEAARQPGETDTPTLRFNVRDTGIGMDDNAIAGTFQHFTQADASINRQFEGSGLGLAICKGLVELMGGEIGVESRSGEGSTFWFTLPYEPAAMADATPADAVAPAGRVTGSRALRTLVAEDNQVNQAIISATLASFGHDLKIVDNGQACVDALLADDFDLILMDVRMPTMSGIEATQKIREFDGPKGAIPIVALTADALMEHRQRHLEAGMNVVAVKPIDRQALAATMDAALGVAVHVAGEATPGPSR